MQVTAILNKNTWQSCYIWTINRKVHIIIHDQEEAHLVISKICRMSKHCEWAVRLTNLSRHSSKCLTGQSGEQTRGMMSRILQSETSPNFFSSHAP